MPRPASPHPTDGELEILRILWANGPMALSAICKQMRNERTDRKVATTTVATMLRVMLDKRTVLRKGAARGATWEAAVTHQKTANGMVSKLVEGVFEGSADRLVMHLVEGGEMTGKQLAELRKMIDQRSKKGAKR